jgi:putative glutamine amidotransferase
VSVRLKIGISACFFHADPRRPVFTGKTLQYVEQSFVHWLQSTGAMTLMIPAPEADGSGAKVALGDYADLLDGLVLSAGSDMWPGSYGETPLRPEWSGDKVRDAYEIALTHEFVTRGKPVLGLCRGLQVLNVAFGGTLYQDIATQREGACLHRNAQQYDQWFHSIEIEAGSRLAALYPGVASATVNSVHHQGIKDLAPGFVVEARCPDDDVIEAIRKPGASYLAGVQWHPEFHERANSTVLPGDPLLAEFLAACDERRA